METTTLVTPDLMHTAALPLSLLDDHPSPSSSSFDTMPTTQYLKMEDLQQSSSPTATDSATPPPTVIVRSVPAKKRKSWGQELPEPKTALPPRKRAKTEDEKEQRRIERIKRNRAAAHNSRERKRQETDNLAVLLAHANAKLDAYHKLHGPLPKSVVLPEVHLSMELEDEPTPAPSTSASRLSYDAATPRSPVDTVMNTTSPMIKREAYDLPLLDLPSFDLSPKSTSALPHIDAMQHSAEMLFDLPCPSIRGRPLLPRQLSNNHSSISPTSWWTHFMLHLMTINLNLCYRQMLTAIWMASPLKTARLISLSTRRMQIRSRLMTSSTRTRVPLRSTRPLAQLNAATGPVEAKGDASTTVGASPRVDRAATGRGLIDGTSTGHCEGKESDDQ